MRFGSFPVSGTQVEFYSQPAGHDCDGFVVEITRPFTASLAGVITLDLGTVTTPTQYLAAFDLTQARGSSIRSATNLSSTFGGLTGSTSLKARINYTGALTDGEFKIHMREAIVATLDDPLSWLLPPSRRQLPSVDDPAQWVRVPQSHWFPGM